MDVVVIGGNSFLGRHLIQFLAAQGATVFATYRTHDGRLEPLRALRNVHLVQLEIAEQQHYQRLPRHADALVHLSAESIYLPGSIDGFIACNVVETQNVARYAKAAGIRNVVHSSSISIYGDVRVPHLDEMYPITNPDDYGVTKYLAERILLQTEGLPCVSLRLPGIVGHGAHRAWIPELYRRVLNGERYVKIYNPTSRFNNVVHVSEISQFIWLLLNTTMSGFKAVNVAADGEMTITEIVDLMMEISGKDVEVILGPAPKRSFTISSDRAKSLGYNTRSIQQILRSYFEESV